MESKHVTAGQGERRIIEKTSSKHRDFQFGSSDMLQEEQGLSNSGIVMLYAYFSRLSHYNFDLKRKMKRVPKRHRLPLMDDWIFRQNMMFIRCNPIISTFPSRSSPLVPLLVFPLYAGRSCDWKLQQKVTLRCRLAMAEW